MTKWEEGVSHGKFFMFAVEDAMIRLYMSTNGDDFEMVAEDESILAERGLFHTCFTAVAGGGPVQIYVDGVPTGSAGRYQSSSPYG